MKNTLFLLSLALMFSACNCGGSNSDKKSADTSYRNDTNRIIPKAVVDTSGQGLLNLSEDILNLLKTKNYQQLSQYIHPVEGLRFSPYGYIDTLSGLKFTSSGFAALDTSKKLLWGHYDGSGAPIRLSLNKYFDKFVYDADFINAPQKAANGILGQGNSINNLKEIYPGSYFTEFYFPGADPRYGGMDWKSLRLVFKEAEDKLYLVAIVHDQWTI